MRETLEIKYGLLLTISAPLKPGTINRMSPDLEFEGRLLEILALSELVDKAYLRGRELASGKITAQRLGLGDLITSALKTSMRLTGLKPMLGLTVASLTLSALKGVSDGLGRGLRENLRQFILSTLYRSSIDDSLRLIEGLEFAGVTLYLEKLGITRSRVSLESLTLGHIYEVLSVIDTGFMLNLKSLDVILELSKRISEEKVAVKAVIEAYKLIAQDRKLLDPGELTVKSLEEFLKIDRKLKAKRETLDSLLGGVFLASTLALLERGSWAWLPP